jgi:hypothetical protein
VVVTCFEFPNRRAHERTQITHSTESGTPVSRSRCETAASQTRRSSVSDRNSPASISRRLSLQRILHCGFSQTICAFIRSYCPISGIAIKCFSNTSALSHYAILIMYSEVCYNEQFLSIKSGCYNAHRYYNERGEILSADVASACA